MNSSTFNSEAPSRVVIVGGGAGGLELATRLGHRLRDDPIEVVLVDTSLTHIWKPLLHEVAAGSLDTGNNEIDYLAHARQHGFQFHLGSMDSIDRTQRMVWLQAIQDEDGRPIAERRSIRYDVLVVAIGSQVNDFHTPGVVEHAILLDTAEDARRLHKRLMAICLRLNEGLTDKTDIAIIGGGATGVELAAELRDTLNDYNRYIHARKPLHANITLIEASDHILGHVSDGLRDKVQRELQAKNVRVLTQHRVEAVTEEGVRMAGGGFLPAQLVVWAAGVKAPELLTQLDGLACNKINQLLVTPTLQTTQDERIFAMGDCAACTLPGRDKPIPPLAQVAHQEAHHLEKVIPLFLRGDRELPTFNFKDHGVLISLGSSQAVGQLVGQVTGHRFQIDGWLARWSYWALYKGYMRSLHGSLRMALSTLGNWLTHSTKSRVKLH